jgi:hypothetical protein
VVNKLAKNTNLAGKKQGRPKGAKNKATAELKEMILGALSDAGGQEYLLDRANDPKTQQAFLSLIGKVLPMTIAGDPNAPVYSVTRIELVPLGSGTDKDS